MAKVLCIEIGTATTTAVLMDYQSKRPRVYRCATMPTPAGAVRDGYLDEDMLQSTAAELKAALKKKKMRAKRVIFTIFSGRLINREILLPAVKKHQINAVIGANITEYFPIELDAYKITHILLKTYRDGENAGKHKVLVLAAERKMLEGYERLAAMMGKRLMDIDYAGNGVFQAVRRNIGAESAVVVRAEAESAIISIVRQGELILQRNLNYAREQLGGGTFTRQDMLETLGGTIQRVIEFYTNGKEENHVGQVCLVGSEADEELQSVLAQTLSLNCRLLENINGIGLKRKAHDMPMTQYAAVIGSGLASVGFANEKEKERKETNYVNASVLMIIFVIVSAAALVSLAVIPYNAALLEQSTLERKQEQLSAAQDVLDQYEKDMTLLEQLNYGNALTRHFNDGIIDFLDELEDVMPKDVELTDFASDDEQCVMTIRVDDKETAAGIINNLRDFESLESVTVESIIEEEADSDDEQAVSTEPETTVNFTVTCTYKQEQLIEPSVDTQTQETATGE